MRLIRGSYAYIIGLFILGAESICAIVAFFFGLFNHSDLPNPLLSEFGSNVASGIFTLITSSLFAVWTAFCSLMILYSALRKNTLDRPMRFIAVALFVFAGVTAFAAIFYRPQEPFGFTLLRAFKGLPAVLLGICLLQMASGRAEYKKISMFLCLVCGVMSFVGYGFYMPLKASGPFAREAINSYIAQLLFSFALLLFFVGLCFFAAGLEKREKKPKE